GQLAHLEEALSGVEPLYRQEDIVYFDRFLDGDDYAGPGYRRRFQAILAALEEGTVLHITYRSPRTGLHTGEYRPLRLEYSPRGGKVRNYAVRLRGGAAQGCHVRSLGRIVDHSPSEARYGGAFAVAEWRRRHRCAQPLLLRVSGERNGVERFMLEF